MIFKGKERQVKRFLRKMDSEQFGGLLEDVRLLHSSPDDADDILGMGDKYLSSVNLASLLIYADGVNNLFSSGLDVLLRDLSELYGDLDDTSSSQEPSEGRAGRGENSKIESLSTPEAVIDVWAESLVDIHEIIDNNEDVDESPSASSGGIYDNYGAELKKDDEKLDDDRDGLNELSISDEERDDSDSEVVYRTVYELDRIGLNRDEVIRIIKYQFGISPDESEELGEVIPEISDMLEVLQDKIIAHYNQLNENSSAYPAEDLLEADESLRELLRSFLKDNPRLEAEDVTTFDEKEEAEDVTTFDEKEDGEEGLGLPPKKRRRVVTPGGLLVDHTDEESVKIETSIDVWADAVGNTLVDLELSADQLAEISHTSSDEYTSDSLELFLASEKAQMQFLRRARKKFKDGEFSQFSLLKTIETSDITEGFGDSNKSIIHPIFKETIERFSGESIFQVDDNGGGKLRDDAIDIIDFIDNKVVSLLKGLREGIGYRTRSSPRGSKMLEIRIEKANIAAGNAIEAIKIWDAFNDVQSNRLGVRIADNLRVIKRIEEGTKAFEHLVEIIIMGSLVYYQGNKFEKVIANNANVIGADQSSLREAFDKSLRVQISGKIRDALDIRNYDGWTSPFITLYVVANISIEHNVMKGAIRIVNKDSTGSSYISCPLCNKNIRYKTFGRKGGKRERVSHDYKIREYSLIRKGSQESVGGVTTQYPGGIIPKDELFGHPGVVIDGEIELINWSRAREMMAEKSSVVQRNGNRARNKILEALGGEPLSHAERYVSSTKFACPMMDYDIPEGSVTTRECGYSLDISSMDDSSDVNPANFKTKFSANIPGTTEPENFFERINESNISEEGKSVISDYVTNKRSGGWNFSRTKFACPCHIEPESFSKDDMEVFRERFSSALLLIPHIGFAKRDALESSDVLEKILSPNNLEWVYHPPTDSSGQSRLFEEGSSGYIVCGASTSISSFLRGAGQFSLKSLVEKVRGTKGEPEVEKIISQLLKLGVDVHDIVEMDLFFESTLDKSSRHSLVSNLLKSAMATSVSSNTGDESTLDIIGDLGLRCGKGHIFTIGQSVRVGTTHAGTSAGPEMTNPDGVLSRVGLDNFGYINDRYFRPVTLESDLERLRSTLDGGSSYSGFALSGVKFPSPIGDGNMVSFSKSKESKMRSRVFVPGNLPDKSSVYSYDSPERDDLGLTQWSGEYSSGDAGDVAAENSNQAEDRAMANKESLQDVVSHIFELLSGVLNTAISLRKTSQSLDIESVLLSDEEECCRDEDVRKIKDVFSLLFKAQGAFDTAIDGLLLDLDNELINRLKGQKISAIRGYGRVGIESIFTRIVVENLKLHFIEDAIDAETMNKVKEAVSKSVEILVPRGYEYSDLFPEDSGSKSRKQGIILRRRAEHVGRQIMGGTAKYFADVVASIFKNRFSEKLSSSMFSGLNIDIDISDGDSVINLDFSDIAILKSEDYLNECVDNFNSEGGDIETLYESYVDSRARIKTEIIRFRGMVTTQKYMSEGADIASRGIDEALSVENDVVRRNIKRYIFGEDKIINISLSPESKHISGADQGELVGGYTSPVLAPNYKFGDQGIIHVLSDGSTLYDTAKILTQDEHKFFSFSEYSVSYILGLVRGAMPYGCDEIPVDVLASLKDRLKDSQWAPCFVNRIIDGKAPYTLKESYKLSILNHPRTNRVKGDDNKLYYENNDIGLNTMAGIQLGQQTSSTAKNGVSKMYPPSPYAPTSVGIPLPLDYSGSYSKSSGTFNIPHLYTVREDLGEYSEPKFRVPIQECNSPIDIELEDGPINAADFMKRSPKYAIPIFNEIDETYETAIRDAADNKDKARAIIDNARAEIKQLHNKYRNLPFEVESAKNRTGTSPKGGFRNIGGLYISMWDYQTMYKMATWPAYSIEWGGPGRYSDPSHYEKIVMFISNLYNLESIASAISDKTDEEYTVEDVLNGVKKGMKKDYIAGNFGRGLGGFYSVGAELGEPDANISIYTDWDYPGAGSGEEADLNFSSYSDRIDRLGRIQSQDSPDRLSPTDIATIRGLYGQTGGPGSKVQLGPYGETKASDSTLSVYAFTTKLRDFITNFTLKSSASNKESSSKYNSKFLAKISERKGDLRRIIFMSEVESLLGEFNKK
jgi:hypothetical protein